MKPEKFLPTEIIFSPTNQCNLKCAHCETRQNKKKLSKKKAIRFLDACHKAGINKVGFTGGEPFYALDFLCRISEAAVQRGIFFDHIITNASWFKNDKELRTALKRLFLAGYDGRFFVSVDAFHRQSLKKVSSFIKMVTKLFNQPDIVSIASVKGTKEPETLKILKKLANLLNAVFKGSLSQGASIKNKDLIIKIFSFGLSPIGRAASLRNPWDGKWFKEDFCKGPGNVFFVLADGTIKPCCGYAHYSDMLTIGSIEDNPRKLMANAGKNRFVTKIFESGLQEIRRQLEGLGLRFPGKTSDHCFFCHYLTSSIPRKLLNKCLIEK
ncbi:MAG: radical SAM protein [Candidatus Omnitrophica bacterium]|nr:radical SAM protein [Candidatus Omnitrophota bacterium]